jgi:hypothetical protein
MNFRRTCQSLAVAAFVATATLTAGPAFAAASDYKFELIRAEAAGPGKTIVTVRLVHVPDNKSVNDAVLFETKTDMGPSGMGDMSGKVTALPAEQAGLYRLQTETGMEGKWALKLGAKVQGEKDTVRSTLTYTAAK